MTEWTVPQSVREHADDKRGLHRADEWAALDAKWRRAGGVGGGRLDSSVPLARPVKNSVLPA